MIALKGNGLALAALIGVIAVMMSMNKPHSEDALMTDWSDPPPLPIFIAVNFLAGLLHSMADALLYQDDRHCSYHKPYCSYKKKFTTRLRVK
jgi:hypothetical protein